MRLDTTNPTLPPVGALLRRPALMVRHEVMNDLHQAGFSDVLPAHLGVFQYPGPDGQRPGVLATRTQASKQAMNHLLHQLESGGYIVRDSHPHDRRTRVVRLTERGWAAHSVIQQTTTRLERKWYQALGEDLYGALSTALERLQDVFENQPTSHPLTEGNPAAEVSTLRDRDDTAVQRRSGR
jgi:DNA-binding MarR family transcriptional regulator